MENTLSKLVKFSTDRGLDRQDFNIEVASLNIIEELLEAHGVHDLDTRDFSTMMYSTMKLLVDSIKVNRPKCYVEPTIKDRIDAFMDISVYAFGEPLKMGYNSEICLAEVEQEISSRVGVIVDGKFVKDKSEQAQKLWYKADFSKAKIEN